MFSPCFSPSSFSLSTFSLQDKCLFVKPKLVLPFSSCFFSSARESIVDYMVEVNCSIVLLCHQCQPYCPVSVLDHIEILLLSLAFVFVTSARRG